MNYNFKQIHAILPATQLINVVLSKTQRKTPTVLHKNCEISRTRSFYMRKIKFTQSSIAKKLETVIKDFPTLADIHPFYSDLFNILYSRDHYKLALGHISSCNNLISHISGDYLKLLKYGDSQYRCKMLKRAALGRMCTMLKKLKPSLEFLENVRQNMARLPSINPFGRTIVITGFPNVGKSSFINNITQANSDVQEYQFTTQQLVLGHTFYNYLEFQVLDTPGLLDHELESRNTIEMQAITALAHLKSCIVFILDGTGVACGKSLEEQKSLFDHVAGLFKKKPVVIGVSKWDLLEPEEREERLQEIKQLFSDDENIKDIVVMSNISGEGIGSVKEAACKSLLEMRVGEKQAGLANTLQSREETIQRGGMYIAQPKIIRPGDRKPCIPEGKKELGRPNLRVLENELGGPGVFNFPMQEHFELEKQEWKYDIVPEIMDGKNIADFVDKDILTKLQQLELEEEQVIDDEDDFEPLDENLVQSLKQVREKKGVLKQFRKMKRNQRAFEKGKPGLTEEKVKEQLGEGIARKIRSQSQRRSKSKRRGMDMEDEGEVVNVGMEEEDGDEVIKKKVLRKRQSQSRSRSKGASVVRTPQQEVFEKVRQKIVKQYKNASKYRRCNVGDVRIENEKPRHLNSGKRSFKADYR